MLLTVFIIGMERGRREGTKVHLTVRQRLTHRNGMQGVQVRVIHCNGTQGIRAGDSSECNAGAGRGPRYIWLSANCTEIGVIRCKLCPLSHHAYYKYIPIEEVMSIYGKSLSLARTSRSDFDRKLLNSSFRNYNNNNNNTKFI